jgi:hypothetical protein
MSIVITVVLVVVLLRVVNPAILRAIKKWSEKNEKTREQIRGLRKRGCMDPTHPAVWDRRDEILSSPPMTHEERIKRVLELQELKSTDPKRWQYLQTGDIHPGVPIERAEQLAREREASRLAWLARNK